MKRIKVIGIGVFAFFGLADSLYLVQNELRGTPLLCNIENLSGCNIVTTSQYSHIFGIPLAELGIIFYGTVFILAALEIVIFHRFLRRALQVVAIAGVISSLYFTFVQAFLIGAFCVYCLASAITTLCIFVLATFIEPIRKKTFPVSAVPPSTSTETPNLPMPPL